MYIDANTQLAIQAGRELSKLAKVKTVVVLPDGPEFERSSKLFKTALEMSERVSMSHLYEGREPLKKGLQLLFGMDQTNEVPVAAAEADVHIVINISTNELLDVQKYIKEVRAQWLKLALLCGSCEQGTHAASGLPWVSRQKCAQQSREH